MKYTNDGYHYPILGKAGDFVDVLSRVPADTEIVADIDGVHPCKIWRNAISFEISSYLPFEHQMRFDDDGTLRHSLCVRAYINWNRDNNLAEASTFSSMFKVLENLLHTYGDGYDTRKLPKPESIARTVARNPFAFLDMLNEFQKKYKNKQECKDKKK